MVKLQRILAIPMALTAAGCLWLLWRMGGGMPLRIGIVATLAVIFMLAGAGVMQRKGRQTGYVATLGRNCGRCDCRGLHASSLNRAIACCRGCRTLERRGRRHGDEEWPTGVRLLHGGLVSNLQGK
jgi:hypothetical protein